jgi:hypothetical protein
MVRGANRARPGPTRPRLKPLPAKPLPAKPLPAKPGLANLGLADLSLVDPGLADLSLVDPGRSKRPRAKVGPATLRAKRPQARAEVAPE